MRLFIALDIDDGIRERIARFAEGLQGFAPEARWVKPESLHVTLKFIGEQPDEAFEPIKISLATVESSPPAIHFCGYGFFPTTKSARVFWIGMDAGPELAELALKVEDGMAALGIPKENRAFSPHLTLARSAGGTGSVRGRQDTPARSFQRLQEKLAAFPPPDFGTMTAREFFLYRSQLSPKGSRYTKLAAFPLSVATG